MKKYRLILLLMLFIVSACMPEDTPISPIDKGKVEVHKVGIGRDYEQQVYWSLQQGELVRRTVDSWHIGLQCSGKERSIILNSGLFMKVLALQTPFDSVRTIPTEGIWRYEPLFQGIDSTAIAQWYNSASGTTDIISKNLVYIVDLGIDALGRSLGYRKIQMLAFQNGEYRLRIADLQHKHDTIVRWQTDSSNDFQHYSLLTTQPALKAPSVNEWDFLFTRYTHLFYVPEQTPYAVTGIVINPKRITVHLDTTQGFESINRTFAEGLTYLSSSSSIGYDWKWFSLQDNTFYIRSNWVYILRTASGYYYKLRFLDFYDEQGQRGTTTFELQRL